MKHKHKSLPLIFLALLISLYSKASHIYGGEMTYQYLGDNKYKITLTYYRDCIHGLPQAMLDDNPAFISIFNGDNKLILSDEVPFSSKSKISITDYGCHDSGHVCIDKIDFTKTYLLPEIDDEYYVVNQHCCKEENLTNIVASGEVGSTHYCIIPPVNKGKNSSAVFTDLAPPLTCINNTITVDNSATDADGDSLSYEFCNTYKGGSIDDIKPVAGHPPFIPISYSSGYTFNNPLGNPINSNLNSKTGMATFSADKYGSFLIGIACNEWRNNQIINTVRREYSIDVTTTAYIFSIGPNPCTDALTVTLFNAEHSSLAIYSVAGSLLERKMLNQGVNSIDMSRYAKGIYFVRYEDHIQKKVTKILKL